jgi:Cellulase N-terminal ig-like domain
MLHLSNAIFRFACTVTLAVSASAVIPLTATGEEFAWIRVNQVGYLPDDPKIAVLSSDRPLEGTLANLRPILGPIRARGDRLLTTIGSISVRCAMLVSTA